MEDGGYVNVARMNMRACVHVTLRDAKRKKRDFSGTARDLFETDVSAQA